MLYDIWDSLVSANATIEEQFKWWNGGYPKSFIAHLVALNYARKYIALHVADAQERAIKKKGKK